MFLVSAWHIYLFYYFFSVGSWLEVKSCNILFGEIPIKCPYECQKKWLINSLWRN